MTGDEYGGFLFGAMKNVMEIDGGEGVQLCEYIKCHWILRFNKREWGRI